MCYNGKSTFIISSQNVLNEIQCTLRYVSAWTAATAEGYLEHLSRTCGLVTRKRAIQTPDVEKRVLDQWFSTCQTEARRMRNTVLDHVDKDAGVSMRQVEQK